jgi:RNA polymerase-binding protein DksA
MAVGLLPVFVSYRGGLMAAKTHAHLRQRLEARLGEILQRIDRIERDIRKPPERDWTEQALAVENDQVLEGLDEMARAEALDLRRALRRMDDGEYGFCTACREPIDERRLSAAPTAELCVNCAN